MPRQRFSGRTLARSQALQLMFQAEACGRDVAAVLGDDYLLSDGPLDEHARTLALGAGAMRDRLDAVIAASSRNWSVSRMPAADRCLLRIAVYEMLAVDSVPVRVTIDEAVELAKSYGTDDSPAFVNGVLGDVAARLERGEDLLAEAARATRERDEARGDGEDEEDGTDG